MKKDVTTRDLTTTALARLYMSTPKGIRKIAKPWVKRGIKVEGKAEKSAKVGNVQVRNYVKERTKRFIGIGKSVTNALGSSKKKKK
jgi:hypothetical protein